jgi:Carboxypeptidase regulatory-like domain
MKNSTTATSKHLNRRLIAKIIMTIVFFVLLFSPLRADASELSGRIQKLNGQGVAGVTVLAVHIQSGFQTSTVTDAKGYYRFQGIPDGTYRIIFKQPGRGRVVRLVTAIVNIEQTPNKKPTTERTGNGYGNVRRTQTRTQKRVPPIPTEANSNEAKSNKKTASGMDFIVTGAITGVVTDSKNNPIANAQIKITSEETNFSKEIFTDDKGRYEFEEASGKYRVEVQSDGFKTKKQDFEIEDGTIKTRNFQLKRR